MLLHANHLMLAGFKNENRTVAALVWRVSGASGFGTPVALGAPMLVELGHPPLQSVVCLLIMNTLATPYGMKDIGSRIVRVEDGKLVPKKHRGILQQ